MLVQKNQIAEKKQNLQNGRDVRVKENWHLMDMSMILIYMRFLFEFLLETIRCFI